MTAPIPRLGLGIGWRPELALFIERRPGLGFVEVIAEHLDARRPIPDPLQRLREAGVTVVPHGVSLSLGGAEPLDRTRVTRLGRLAERLDAPLVSEHIAFVRAGGREAAHLLPVPRTRAMLEVLAENVRIAQDLLPVPLALENISALFDWPDAELDEAAFIAEVLERTGALLLLDVSNVYANAHNLGGDPAELLTRLPLDRIAYVHVGGGEHRSGLYHDTHAHAVPAEALELLEEICGRARPAGVLLECDDGFPSDAVLAQELDAIATAVFRGEQRLEVTRAGHGA